MRPVSPNPASVEVLDASALRPDPTRSRIPDTLSLDWVGHSTFTFCLGCNGHFHKNAKTQLAAGRPVEVLFRL